MLNIFPLELIVHITLHYEKVVRVVRVRVQMVHVHVPVKEDVSLILSILLRILQKDGVQDLVVN